MEIIKTNRLSDKQVCQIKELESLYHKADKLEGQAFLSNEINFDENIPAFFIAYENETTVGFLTIFFPTKAETEVSGFVHPAYRKRGVFTSLDNAAREVIAENGLGDILYSVETKSESAAEVLKHRKLNEIQHSEYRMELNIQNIKNAPAPVDAEYYASRLTPENIENYTEISNSVYGDKDSGYINTIMTSDDRIGYLFYRNDTPVGIFVIGLEDKTVPFIYGVAISENERGHGYGKLMLEQACKIGTAYGDLICLDVDSENPVAFHIYQSLGFEISFQVDYYKDNKAPPSNCVCFP